MTQNNNGYSIQVATDDVLKLDCGFELSDIEVAYQTYGELNKDKSNAVLVCHALTGDQFVHGIHPVTGRNGWWDLMIGAGKPIDTNKYFVICPNVLGACMGSTGPASNKNGTDQKWGTDFPVVTIRDMVKVQKLLLDELDIDKLFSIVGGSMGGAQALEWAASYPDISNSFVICAIGARYSSQNIAFNEASRQAIMADPAWMQGKYIDQPKNGLAVARMIKHITYMSEQSLQNKFGRNLQNIDSLRYGFDADFQVESYLRHQGTSFVDRFDANSFLYLTRAFDYYDLEASHGKKLSEIYKNHKAKFCIVSFSSDWFSPPEDGREIAQALNAAGVSVNYSEIESDRGHDSFLLNIPEFYDVVKSFIEKCASDCELGDIPQPSKIETKKNIKKARVDHEIISSLISKDSKVLDIGCGNGELLKQLSILKDIDAHGIELDQQCVSICTKEGFSVIQGDADKDLRNYNKNSYDYAILSHTLQAMKNPKNVLEEMIRVSDKAIISFPNFGHWKVRLNLLFTGRMPVNKSIPYSWHETPNIHFCTIHDFDSLCKEMNLKIEKKIMINSCGTNSFIGNILPSNLFGRQAVYLISK